MKKVFFALGVCGVVACGGNSNSNPSNGGSGGGGSQDFNEDLIQEIKTAGEELIKKYEDLKKNTEKTVEEKNNEVNAAVTSGFESIINYDVIQHYISRSHIVKNLGRNFTDLEHFAKNNNGFRNLNVYKILMRDILSDKEFKLLDCYFTTGVKINLGLIPTWMNMMFITNIVVGVINKNRSIVSGNFIEENENIKKAIGTDTFFTKKYLQINNSEQCLSLEDLFKFFSDKILNADKIRFQFEVLPK